MAAAVGVAAALLAVGLVIAIRPGVVGLQSGSSQVTAQELEMTKVEPTPFSATVALSSYGWGTRIDMACSYGEWSGGGSAPPSNLGMVVVGKDGKPTQIATWLGLSGATALPSGNTPLPIERNRRGATGFRRQREGSARTSRCEFRHAVNRDATRRRVTCRSGSR